MLFLIVPFLLASYFVVLNRGHWRLVALSLVLVPREVKEGVVLLQSVGMHIILIEEAHPSNRERGGEKQREE